MTTSLIEADRPLVFPKAFLFAFQISVRHLGAKLSPVKLLGRTAVCGTNEVCRTCSLPQKFNRDKV
eukprot:870496-Rhodomonas_salina.1